MHEVVNCLNEKRSKNSNGKMSMLYENKNNIYTSKRYVSTVCMYSNSKEKNVH